MKAKAARTMLLVPLAGLAMIPGCGSGGGVAGIFNRIYFNRYIGGHSEIYFMNPDGTNQTRFTNTAFPSEKPNPSRDGKKVAFESERDGNDEIYVVNSDGSDLQRLTNNAV